MIDGNVKQVAPDSSKSEWTETRPTARDGDLLRVSGAPEAPGGVRSGRRRRMVNYVGLIALILAGVAGAVALFMTRSTLTPAERGETVYSVSTMAAERSDNFPVITAFGEIAAGREADMRALVQGEVVEVGDYFRNGGTVRQGDLLLRIDPFDYVAAVDELKAQIAETRARVAEARARLASERSALIEDRSILEIKAQDVQRFERLNQKGTISDQSLGNARIEYQTQQQKVTQREAAIEAEQARMQQQQAALERLQVSLARAERDLTRTELRAPFDGFLSQVSAQVGSLLGPSDRVAHLVAADSLEARGHLSDAQYGRLLADGGLDGRPATVTWKMGPERLTYEAVISRITSEIDPGSGGVTFYALLAADGLDLPIRPGAFVEIELPDRRFPDTIRLPAVAVHDDNRVFVIEEGRLVRRDVEVLARQGDDVIVDGELEGGARVVLTRFNEMAPGVRVRDAAAGGDDGAEAASGR